MADNPYVNKVVLGNQTIMDLTQDSVEPSNLLEGETAHSRSGEPITGTAKQGHVIKDQDGTSMTQRGNLKFEGGFNVGDDSQNNTTKVQKDIPITWDEWRQLTDQEAEGKDYYITDEPYVSGKINTEVFTKLWENPNPTSAFAAQTITLASDDYDFLLVQGIAASDNNIGISIIVAKGGDFIFSASSPITNGILLTSRAFTYISDTSYSVDDGIRRTSVDSEATQVQNIRCVPITIYGFKKNIEFDLTALVADVSTDASKCVYDNTDSGLEATNVQDAIDEIAGRGYAKLVFVDTGSIESLNSDAQVMKTHSMGVTVNNPMVVVNLGQNRFQWEVNGTGGGTLSLSFRNVSATSASGTYKVFVFDLYQ